MIVNGLVILSLAVFLEAKPLESGEAELTTTTTVNPIVESAQSKISKIIRNSDLSWRERNRQIDQIYATLPPQFLPHIPLDSDFNRLPIDIYQRINSIHLNEKITLRDRRAQIRQILENLTWTIKTAMQKEEFPLEPPAGFEKVLGSELYQRLLAVHTNLKMSVDEKKQNIDQIMSQVPKEIIDKLPLPQPMGKLPDAIQRNIRKIIYTFQTKWDERLRQLRQYIRTLPKAYRRLLRSGWLKIDEVSKDGAKTEQKIQNLKVEETIEKVIAKVEAITQAIPLESTTLPTKS